MALSVHKYVKNKVTKMIDKWLRIFIVLNIIAVTMHVLMLLTYLVRVLYVYISLLTLVAGQSDSSFKVSLHSFISAAVPLKAPMSK